MFVRSNDFSEIRKYYQEELSSLYSPGELKIILKYLFLKRFQNNSADFLLADEKLLSESDLLFFHEALKRLRSSEPYQYVLGEVEFYGLTLKCDRRALIPRPETEEIVEWILGSHEKKSLRRIVDICAGSGCIALALKSQLPETEVAAWELSDEAIALIKENQDLTNLNVNLQKVDALNDNYEIMDPGKHDLVVSNPPYIPLKDKAVMEKNVLDFEPEIALFVANDDPLVFYREILRKSKNVLAENGWVYFEIHEDLAEEVKALFRQNDFVNIELRKDLQGKDRMVRGQVVPCKA